MSQASRIGRTYDRQKVVFANGAAISSGGRMSGIIDASWAAGGSIRVPGTWTAADISFMAVTQPGTKGISPIQGNPPGDETAAIVRKIDGTMAKITGVATGAAAFYPIPAEALVTGYFYLKSTNTASEADVTQGAAREVWVLLKG